MPRPARILIATPLYPPEIGGPATYTAILEKELPKRGILVEILPFREVRPLPKIVRHGAYFLRCLAKGRDCDILFAQDPVSVGLPSFLAAKIMGKRFFLKVVGDYAWEMEMQNLKIKNQDDNAKFINLEQFQIKKFGFITEFRRRVERFVASKAERVIVPSEYLKKIILMWGVPPARIEVIYNSFPPPIVRQSRDELRQKLGLSGTVIVSVGRLVPWKGFAAIIELMPEVLAAVPDANLLIVGDGPERANLQLTTDNLQLKGVVKFLGRLRQKILSEYLAAADVFVLNTGYEGFSHVILETLSLGLPVVTTPSGGNKEIIKDGDNGLLVGFNDKREFLRAIIRVIRDRAFRELLSNRAKGSVEGFNVQSMVNNLTDILS